MGLNDSAAGESTIGAGYLESYAEIPAARVEDSYLAAKKLGGHLRLFDPQDLKAQHDWLTSHLTALEIAYSKEAVATFIERISTAMLG
ncbi:hypothetical protein HYU89_00485 [Candidatus Collierbacteria bacterium]|nr:hypothetical protein [Candidatus Collierbacteria bacterium]